MDNPWATDAEYHRPKTPSPSDEDVPEIVPDDDWGTAWASSAHATQPPDQWEAARQEKEKLDHALPPELLDSLLRHCQQVSQEIWPAPESSDEDNWRSGFDDLNTDITALLAQLAPTDPALPPTVQFSATATAKAMNEALKLTRHLPASASSPLSRLLASRGSLEWQKSIRFEHDIVSDTLRVGWRVLEKEDRLSTSEEPKPKKASASFLSFWNRRASAIQGAPVETPVGRPSSPARSSSESVSLAPRPPPLRAASPPKVSTPSVPPPPPPDSSYPTVATTPVPSVVSRFLNRFTKGSQHSALALSSEDLEFLSDIVPSASDPPDEDINDSALGALAGAGSSSPLPPKLPPPIPPPPKQPTLSSRSSSPLVPGISDSAKVVGSTPTACQVQGAYQTPNVPVLAPPLSPTSFLHIQGPSSSLKDAATPAIVFGQSSTPSTQQRLQSSSQPSPHFPFLTLSPPLKAPQLSIPPLLPPPPVSPPQTPRPSTFSLTAFDHSSTTQNCDTSSFYDPHKFDDEFTAFTSFPPSAPGPSPSYPQRSPSPPSPPPRRTYERTHYPSSSPISSILSPASQSLDHLCSTKSSISASLDSFDDFVSPPTMRGGNRKLTPPPPPLPAKSQSQHWQLPHIDTYPSRVHHAHTPSQAFSPPTVHTSLMASVFSVSSVSNAEHQRTQALVDHAAARRGSLWPNPLELDEPKAKAILPPSSASPKSLVRDEDPDLLGDDTLGSGLNMPLSVVGGIGTDSVGTLHAPFGVASGLGKAPGLSNQLQPSLPSTSAPILSLSPLGSSTPPAATNCGSPQPAKPRELGGLSAQDISFFEGL